MITFKCPSCQREARAADEHAGKRAKCPKCNHVFQIPGPGEAVKPSKAATAPPAKTKPTASNGAPKATPPAPKSAAKKAPPPPPPDFEEVEDDEEEEDVADAVAADDDEDEEPVEDPDEVEDEDEEEEEEERPRKKKKPKKKLKRKGRDGAWAPCPRCGDTDATKQYFTWWGGFLGPAIINTVRCNDCGTTYNGIHGDYNTNRILIYCLVPAGIAIVLFGGCGVLSALMNL